MDETITHIGGSEDDGSSLWGLTREETIQRIESHEWSFFVARPAADPVPVLVRHASGAKMLTTARDDTQTNNLDSLPVRDPPLAGIDPHFPLSIPGPRQPELVELKGPAVGGGGVVVLPDPGTEHYRIPGWIAGRQLQLRLKCKFPWPAFLEIYIERDPTQPQYVEASHRLTKVDDIQLGEVLWEQGRGWYWWDLVIPDSSYPRRFTPGIVVIGVPPAYWTETGLTLYIRNVSYNRYCGGPSVPRSLAVYRTNYVPNPMYGTTGPGPAPAPPREYKIGAFRGWQPAVKGIGESIQRGPDKHLAVKSPAEVGLGGWSQFGVYTNPVGGQKLCEFIGFEVLPGPGTKGGGIGFSDSGEFGVGLAIKQPTVPGHSGDILFRFVKLGAPSSAPMDVAGFLTTPLVPVTPQLFFDQAEQVALFVDANRPGPYTTHPRRARLLDLGHGGFAIPGSEIMFYGTTVSAEVLQRPDRSFYAAIRTDVGTVNVDLPKG